MSTLYQLLSEIIERYPGYPVYIRGDANVNYKDKKRSQILKKLAFDFNLESTKIDHNTYHHFTGEGRSDSQLDVLLHSKDYSDDLVNVFCRNEDPTILSHHDIILSCFSLPHKSLASDTGVKYQSAPTKQQSQNQVDRRWC